MIGSPCALAQRSSRAARLLTRRHASSSVVPSSAGSPGPPDSASCVQLGRVQRCPQPPPSSSPLLPTTSETLLTQQKHWKQQVGVKLQTYRSPHKTGNPRATAIGVANIGRRGTVRPAAPVNAEKNGLGEVPLAARAPAQRQPLRPPPSSQTTRPPRLTDGRHHKWSKDAVATPRIPREGSHPWHSKRFIRAVADSKKFVTDVGEMRKKKNWRDVLTLLRQAEGDGRAMNQIMYNACIAALAKSGRWEEAMEILERMRTNGVPRCVKGYTAALTACRNARKWEQAVSLLNEMKVLAAAGDAKVAPNSWGYNITIMACAAEGQWEAALVLFDDMKRREGVRPTDHTYMCLLDAYRVAGQSERAEGLLREMRMTAGIQSPDVNHYNMCIGATVAGGDFARALRLLEDMQDAGLMPDAKSVSTAMRACLVAKQWDLPLSLLDKMREQEAQGRCAALNVWVFNVCITACGRAGRWERAVELLGEMWSTAGVKPDANSFASAMTACIDSGEYQRAMSLFEESMEAGLSPNLYQFNIVLNACSKTGDEGGMSDRAMAILGQIRRAGLSPDIISYNSAIAACARATDWNRALLLLADATTTTGIKPDVITYTSVISSFTKDREWERALTILSDMQVAGLKPTEHTYAAAIGVCGEASQTERGLALFEDMKRSGVLPSVISYTAAIDSCSLTGEWERALGLLEEMRATGVRRNVLTYNAVIRACAHGGCWGVGMSLFRQMRADENIEPVAATFNVLIRGLVGAPS